MAIYHSLPRESSRLRRSCTGARHLWTNLPRTIPCRRRAQGRRFPVESTGQQKHGRREVLVKGRRGESMLSSVNRQRYAWRRKKRKEKSSYRCCIVLCCLQGFVMFPASQTMTVPGGMISLARGTQPGGSRTYRSEGAFLVPFFHRRYACGKR
jgi:hypothetical protein